MTLAHKWMIHPTPWPLVFLIFVTSNLLPSIVFIHSHGCALESCHHLSPRAKLDSGALPRLSSFSLFVQSSVYAPLGDLQTLAALSSSDLLWLAIFVPPLSCLLLWLCVTLIALPSNIFSVPAAPKQTSHNRTCVNVWLMTTAVLSSPVTLLVQTALPFDQPSVSLGETKPWVTHDPLHHLSLPTCDQMLRCYLLKVSQIGLPFPIHRATVTLVQATADPCNRLLSPSLNRSPL